METIEKYGGVTTKEKRVHPLPFSFLFSHYAIFAFKKNRKGAGDVSSSKDEIYFEDDLRFKENGDIDYDGDTLALAGDGTIPEDPELTEGVLALNSKKIEEMSGSIQDVKTRLEKFDTTMKGIKNDSDGLKEEIVQMNDSIKKMLCIYEAITQQYNPFIDDVPTAHTPSREPIAQSMEHRSKKVEEEPLDRIIKPEDFEADVEEANSSLGEVVGVNNIEYDPRVKKSEPLANVARVPCSLSNEKMTVSLQKDTITVTPTISPARGTATFQDACRDQISKVIDLMNEKARMEELVDRVYVQKISGNAVSASDIEYLKDWCRKNGR